MRVPLQPSAGSITNAASPNLGTDFRMWYSMRVGLPTTTEPLVFYQKDRQIPNVNEQFSDPEIWDGRLAQPAVPVVFRAMMILAQPIHRQVVYA
jgi:hypothetical protein